MQDFCKDEILAFGQLLFEIAPQNPIMIHVEDVKNGLVLERITKKKDDRQKRLESCSDYDLVILPASFESLPREQCFRIIDRILGCVSKGIVFFLSKKKEDGRLTLSSLRRYNLYYKNSSEHSDKKQLVWIRPQEEKMNYPYEGISILTREKRKKLRIAYLLPHKGLTGGIKMMLEQMRYLKKRGHIIRVLAKSNEPGERAIPDWYDLEVDEETVVLQEEDFLPYIHDTDIIFSGWITQLIELQSSTIPVVYWEQGYQYLFGDVEDFKGMRSCLDVLSSCYHTKHAILSVSDYVAGQILRRYGRKTPVLENGIDTTFYRPAAKSNHNRILLVGNANQPFKNFSLAFQAIECIRQSGIPFEAEWVTPVEVESSAIPDDIQITIKPEQEVLVKAYQRADVLLFTSQYEGFGMPPLEAMACKTPVICTDSGGIRAYARHQYNALIAEKEDAGILANHVMSLFQDHKQCERLGENGRDTARMLDYSKIGDKLETYLDEIAKKRE